MVYGVATKLCYAVSIVGTEHDSVPEHCAAARYNCSVAMDYETVLCDRRTMFCDSPLATEHRFATTDHSVALQSIVL